MFKVYTYLNFPGNTEEAFNFYKSVFGGEFSSVMRYGDMPPSEEPMPEEMKNLIMHISLPIGEGAVLMGTDAVEGMGQKVEFGNNMYVFLSPDSVEEGQKLFDVLSQDGEVEMEYEKMFWGDYYGAFKDKFGVQWMVNCADK